MKRRATLATDSHLSLPAAENGVLPGLAGALALGAVDGKVQLVPHHPLWKTYFDAERRSLYAALAPYIKEIRHIGSTAIPGICAKPILDIMVGLVNIADVRDCEAPLAALDYIYKGEQDISGWHFFKKKIGGLTTHHLHVVQWNSAYWVEHILFQEYLFRHPEVAEAYERLKLALAEKYIDDREAYTRDKTDFINKVTEMARRVQQYQPAPNGRKGKREPQPTQNPHP